jgi:hypothetical protein
MVNWPALLFSTQKNVTGGAPGSFGVEAPRKRIQEQSDFGPSPKSCYRKLTLTLLPFDNVIPRRTRNQIGSVLLVLIPGRRPLKDASPRSPRNHGFRGYGKISVAVQILHLRSTERSVPVGQRIGRNGILTPQMSKYAAD